MTQAPKTQLPKSDYKEYPKSLAPDDFWGQVRRTVHGKAVSEDQIRMIVCAIGTHLSLRPNDAVLDLACGNGALTRYLYASCQSILGVDHSEYLIDVARRNFERPPNYTFVCEDAARYTESEPAPERFTAAICYGSFSYFAPADAVTVLTSLRRRFTQLRRLFIGNLPDKARAASFFPPSVDYVKDLDDHASQIGIWRTHDEFAALAAAAGWRARFFHMPPDFFGARYRYDVVLEPDGP